MGIFGIFIRNCAADNDVHCIICGDRSDSHINGVPICSRCNKSAPWIGESTCIKCGRALPLEGHICNTCAQNEILFSRGLGVFEYKGVARDLVHSLKYGKNRWIAKAMGLLMAKKFMEGNISADMVTFMPMHEKSLAKREFNQAHEIAYHFSLSTSLPLEDLLLKRINTPKQSRSQSATQRYSNVKNMLTVYPHIEDSNLISGKRVVVIDDVFTTGASMNEAARALLKAGASEVYCVYFAAVSVNKK